MLDARPKKEAPQTIRFQCALLHRKARSAYELPSLHSNRSAKQVGEVINGLAARPQLANDLLAVKTDRSSKKSQGPGCFCFS